MTFIWVFNFRPKNFIVLAKQNRPLKFHAINFHYCLTLLECCIHRKFNVFKLQNKPHKFYLHCRFSMLLLKCEYALERGKWIILLKVAIIQICFSGIYYLMLQKFCYCRVEKKKQVGADILTQWIEQLFAMSIYHMDYGSSPRCSACDPATC